MTISPCRARRLKFYQAVADATFFPALSTARHDCRFHNRLGEIGRPLGSNIVLRSSYHDGRKIGTEETTFQIIIRSISSKLTSRLMPVEYREATRIADPVVQKVIGEAAAAIDVATLLLHTGTRLQHR
jgi:hypothetical protein